MTLSLRQYFALAGSKFSQDDARVIGPELQELAKAGDVTPFQIVEAARSTNSPLHEYFEWDDRIAADYYRTGQAQEMIQSIKVKIVSAGEERVTRAYKVTLTPPVQRPVAPVVPFRAPAVERAPPIDQLAAAALRDLEAWLLKYRGQAEVYGKFAEVIAPVANQISEFKDDFLGGHLSGPLRKSVETFLDWQREYGDSAPRLFGEHLNYITEAIEELRKAVVLHKRS